MNSIGSIATRILKSNKENESSNRGRTDQPKDKPVYTAYFKNLVDLVESEGKQAFLIKEDGTSKVLFKIELDGKVYFPPPKDQIPWLLPRADKVVEYYSAIKELGSSIDADRILFEDLVSYHKSISELPSEDYYVLLAAWVMHTYLMEGFHYSPILLFFAVPERGKSRTGKGIIYVAYRGVHTETLNEANLFRWSENHRATLFLDVRDLWNKAEKRGADDILLSRIERGCKVSRVLWPEKGAFRDTKHYDVFDPTIISTNEAVHPILDTRCISIIMSDSVKIFESSVRPEDALSLKERLVEFRLRHLGVPLPIVPKPARGRLGDILKPIYQTIRVANPKREEEFLRLLKQIEEKRRLEKSQSLEAQIVEVLIELEFKVWNGFLPLKDITERVNKEKPERYHISPKRIGKTLRALGFDWGWTHRGTTAIDYDTVKINHLTKSYGLKFAPASPASPVCPAELANSTLDSAENTGVAGDAGLAGAKYNTLDFDENAD